jgi:clan AA aspartic protease
MGTFSVKIEVANLNGDRYQPVEALVDTGSTGTAIPENIFRDLGVIPTGQRSFRLADESPVTYPITQTRVTLMGQNLVVLAVFTPDGTMPLLEATTRETFRLAANPVAQELVETPGLMKRM